MEVMTMSGNNVDGNYRTKPELMMRAYDELPEVARQAFANAVENWVPQPTLTRYRKQIAGYCTGNDIAAKIKKSDRKELEDREFDRCRGKGAYEGNAPDTVLPAYPATNTEKGVR
jgi:hypothetical protein